MFHLSKWPIPAILLCTAVLPAQQSDAPKKNSPLMDAEVRFTDDSVVRMVVVQEQLEVITRYGKLTIPTTEIQSIDFGVHLPEGLQAKIAQAIEQLGHDNYKVRELALRDLVNWGPYAYPQLHAATKSDDPEITKRALVALDRLRSKHPAKNLRLREDDIVVTPSFTVVGKITTATFRAKNENFGEFDLKVAKLRSVRWLNPAYETELAIDASRYGSAPDQWLDTGFEARAGGRLVIMASGTVDLWPQPGGAATYHTTPKGYRGSGALPPPGGAATQQYPGMLLGKIGISGIPFIVGERFDGLASHDGKLYLSIVPSPWGNSSSGAYHVRITPRHEGGGD